MSLFIKNIFLVQLCLILAILYPTSLANLVVEVGTRHSHQTLLKMCLEMLSAVLLFVTKVLVLDLYLIEKVLDVLDVFQVLWLFVLVLVLANMKNTCTWLKYFEKYLTPTLIYRYEADTAFSKNFQKHWLQITSIVVCRLKWRSPWEGQLINKGALLPNAPHQWITAHLHKSQTNEVFAKKWENYIEISYKNFLLVI